MIACMNSIKKLAKRLKELRKYHDLTQEKFADIAGISYKFYQQIESGNKKQIWLSTIERLAVAYNLNVSNFLAPEFPSNSKPKKRR